MADEKLPIEIAELIFNQEPPAEKSIQMFCQTDTTDTASSIELFEIFQTILVEGMFIKYNPITTDTLRNFNEESITNLRPWLRGIGYDVKVTSYSEPDEKLKKEFSKYYCKVIMKCDPSWAMYFEMKDLEDNYHFILGSNSPFIKGKRCTLENMYSIFIANNTTYKISFKCI